MSRELGLRDALTVVTAAIPCNIKFGREQAARAILQALWDEGYRLTIRSDQCIEVRFGSIRELER